MTAVSFAHLHVHTEYSMLDGAARIRDVVGAAAADGQPAIAITDHGVLYGVVDFVKAAREVGIKPIIGTEAYFTDGSRFDRPLGERQQALSHESVGGRRGRLPQPAPALFQGLSRGVLLQAEDGLRASLPARGGDHRHLGLPGRPGAPAPRPRLR